MNRWRWQRRALGRRPRVDGVANEHEPHRPVAGSRVGKLLPGPEEPGQRDGGSGDPDDRPRGEDPRRWSSHRHDEPRDGDGQPAVSHAEGPDRHPPVSVVLQLGRFAQTANCHRSPDRGTRVSCPGSEACHVMASVGEPRHTALMRITTRRLLIGLLAVDTAGGAVAIKNRVAGEPLGIGGSLDVSNPMVVALWGTALSAPISSLGLAAVLYRFRPQALRIMGAAFAVGALLEPAFWGRRPCPPSGRILLMAHVLIGAVMAIGPIREDELVGATR